MFLLILTALAGLVVSQAYAGPETLGATRADKQGFRTMVTEAIKTAGATEAAKLGATEDAEMDEGEGKPPIGILGQVESDDSEAAPLRAKSGLDAFNARNRSQWKASFSRKSGKVRGLHGGVSRSYEDGPENVARGFLRDAHEMLGLKEDLSDLRTIRVNRSAERNHVRMQQLHNGIPVRSAYMLVHSNQQGQVTMVQNSTVESLQPTNQSTLAEDAAKEIARKDLLATLSAGATIGTVAAEQEIMRYQDKYLYVWKISLPTRQPSGQWVYQVDAENGQILYKGNERRSTKSGSGRAYKTNKDWHAYKIGKVQLKYMYTCLETADCGYLFGQHADIYDYSGNDVWDMTFKFIFYPEYYVEDKAPFDAVNTYYQITSAWDWWSKNVINKFVSFYKEDFKYFRPSVYVNSTDPLDQCNAGYWYDIDTEYTMAFGNENTCVAGSEDVALDVDVVTHEYAHAMMDWLGYWDQFGGAVDHYGRSMGEGNSDWFAYLYTKDPYIGDVAWNWDWPLVMEAISGTWTTPGCIPTTSMTGQPLRSITPERFGADTCMICPEFSPPRRCRMFSSLSIISRFPAVIWMRKPISSTPSGHSSSQNWI
ncbi:MAG: hypothetical protein AB9873_04995 [Syntrophobacteraceae bacterium]